MLNFDEKINREKTDAFKLELRKTFFGSDDVLPLWVADMDFKAPPKVIEAIQERASHEIYGYTIRDAKFHNAIKNWLKTEHNWDVKGEEIEFIPGVLPSIVITLLEFTAPGDKVIIQTPVYPPFYSIVKSNERIIAENKLIEDNGYYTIDFDSFEELASDPKTKVFVMSNPHNPVGRAWKEDELKRIAEICIKNDILIVSDEIHSDLCLFGNTHNVFAKVCPEVKDRIITGMAPSKTFNIAGLSTAYAIIHNKEIKARFQKRLNALQLHMGNLFGGVALVAAYNHGSEWLKELKSYLEANIMLVDSFIKENMPEVGFKIPEATYLLWLDFKAWNLSQSELKKALTEIGKVGMNDGLSFGENGVGYQRLNVGSPKDIIFDGLNRILKVRKEVYKK